MFELPTFKKIPLHMWVAASAWGSRIVTGLVQLVSVRVLIVGLGADQYAVFVLLTSLIGWYTLADLGIGLSLQNYISEKRAKNEPYTSYIVTAGIITLAEFALGLIILYGVSIFIAPIFLKQFLFLSHPEKIKLFLISGFVLFVTALTSLTFKIWYAEQKGYLANIVPALTAFLGLAGAWLVMKSAIADKLFWSLIAYLTPALLVGGCLFLFKMISLPSGNRRLEKPVLNALMRRAMRFFSFALLGVLITQIDYFVLSQTVKPHDIIAYNITTKLFSFAYTIYAAVLAAWHPVNCEMYTRKEFTKIKENTRLYVGAGVGGMVVFTVCLLLFMPYLISLFSPKEKIIIPVLFIILSGSYFLIRVWNDTYITVLVSMSRFRQIFIVAPFQIVLSIPLQIILAKKFGIYGIASGLIISYLLTSAWFLPRVAHRLTHGPEK